MKLQTFKDKGFTVEKAFTGISRVHLYEGSDYSSLPLSEDLILLRILNANGHVLTTIHSSDHGQEESYNVLRDTIKRMTSDGVVHTEYELLKDYEQLIKDIKALSDTLDVYYDDGGCDEYHAHVKVCKDKESSSFIEIHDDCFETYFDETKRISKELEYAVGALALEFNKEDSKYCKE